MMLDPMFLKGFFCCILAHLFFSVLDLITSMMYKLLLKYKKNEGDEQK